MPTISYVSVEEFEALKAEVKELRIIIADFLASIDDTVSSAKALQLTGIRSLTTLIAERQRPGTLLVYSHHGRSVHYSRASCLAYRRARQRKQR
jgi:hypothetical protein